MSRGGFKQVDRDRVRTLTEQGKSAPQIGETLGCTKRTVQRIRAELGIQGGVRHPPLSDEKRAAIQRMLDDGASHTEIIHTLGTSQSTLQRWFPGTSWTREQMIEHRRTIAMFGKVA